jgi:hypothetical protein
MEQNRFAQISASVPEAQADESASFLNDPAPAQDEFSPAATSIFGFAGGSVEDHFSLPMEAETYETSGLAAAYREGAAGSEP